MDVDDNDEYTNELEIVCKFVVITLILTVTLLTLLT